MNFGRRVGRDRRLAPSERPLKSDHPYRGDHDPHRILVAATHRNARIVRVIDCVPPLFSLPILVADSWPNNCLSLDAFLR